MWAGEQSGHTGADEYLWAGRVCETCGESVDRDPRRLCCVLDKRGGLIPISVHVSVFFALRFRYLCGPVLAVACGGRGACGVS